MTNAGPVVALEIGGTKIAAGLFDQYGALRARRTVPTELGRGAVRVLDRALDLAEEVRREAERNRLSPQDVSTLSSSGAWRPPLP